MTQHEPQNDSDDRPQTLSEPLAEGRILIYQPSEEQTDSTQKGAWIKGTAVSVEP